VTIAVQDGEATVGDCRGEQLVLEAGQSVELSWRPPAPCRSR
jgi:hypothetical protein